MNRRDEELIKHYIGKSKALDAALKKMEDKKDWYVFTPDIPPADMSEITIPKGSGDA